ncbi:MAG: hypothetical protein KAI38_09055, partial [Candidatus Latescibacteria bacterium]|nr:hypothetical protein [Candidatus Latescibacterota bacterium]
MDVRRMGEYAVVGTPAEYFVQHGLRITVLYRRKQGLIESSRLDQVTKWKRIFAFLDILATPFLCNALDF